MHTFPPHSMPRVEACAEGEPMDVCIAANPDGSVRQWSAALSWEFMPRALVDLVPHSNRPGRATVHGPGAGASAPVHAAR
jgi:hypothetical protein